MPQDSPRALLLAFRGQALPDSLVLQLSAVTADGEGSEDVTTVRASPNTGQATHMSRWIKGFDTALASTKTKAQCSKEAEYDLLNAFDRNDEKTGKG